MLFGATAAQAQFLPAAVGLTATGFNPAIGDVAVKIVAIQPNGLPMQCSGAYISDQGHILLASHCLELALFGKPITNPFQDQNLITLEVNERRSEWRVRLVSPCRRPDIVASLPEYMALVSIRDCEYYDLAILEPIQPQSVAGCVAVNDTSAPMASLFTVGFPVRTFRVRESNSMGDGVYMSTGVVGESPICKVAASSLKSRVGTQISLSQAIDQAQTENAMQTSLDAVPGNSGGLVLDGESGKPVAVVSFSTTADGFDPLRERCEAGSTFITPLGSLERAYEIWSHQKDWPHFVSEMQCVKRRIAPYRHSKSLN